MSDELFVRYERQERRRRAVRSGSESAAGAPAEEATAVAQPQLTETESEQLEPEKASSVAPVVSFVLYQRDGPDVGREYPLSLGETSIGRAPGNDITLNESEVSRWHARVSFVEGWLKAVDLGSSNGTRVNDLPLEPKQWVPLTAGAVLQIASVELEVRASEL